MQAAPGPPPPGATGGGRPGEPLVFYNQKAIQDNLTLLNHNRIFAALVAGCVTGILGITGYKGFSMFVVSQLVMAVALLLKARFQMRKYFADGLLVCLSGLVSQTELLTFVLFWTLSNNLVYLF